MKWSRVFSELGKAAGIVVLVPTVLVAKLRWDSVLPIIIYFQRKARAARIRAE
jgi:hypothetical protein